MKLQKIEKFKKADKKMKIISGSKQIIRKQKNGLAKETKNLLKQRVFIFGIVGIIFLSVIIFLSFNLSAQGSHSKSASTTIGQTAEYLVTKESIQAYQNIVFPAQTSAGIPIRLKIPVINVDAVIDPIGLTSQGAVGVPTGATTTAWYKLGPRPGDIGSAVITGHFGPWRNGQKSVFDNLYKLRQGDKISIEDEKGSIIFFVVRESHSYDPEADASSVFISNDNKSHLNLITCEGAWDSVTKTYSQRLVVFADREE